MNLFGPKSTQKVITTVHTNVSENSDMTNDVANLTIVGNETTGVITSETWLEHF